LKPAVLTETKVFNAAVNTLTSQEAAAEIANDRLLETASPAAQLEPNF
jgi:hypothetical protein